MIDHTLNENIVHLDPQFVITNANLIFLADSRRSRIIALNNILDFIDINDFQHNQIKLILIFGWLAAYLFHKILHEESENAQKFKKRCDESIIDIESNNEALRDKDNQISNLQASLNALIEKFNSCSDESRIKYNNYKAQLEESEETNDKLNSEIINLVEKIKKLEKSLSDLTKKLESEKFSFEQNFNKFKDEKEKLLNEKLDEIEFTVNF